MKVFSYHTKMRLRKVLQVLGILVLTGLVIWICWLVWLQRYVVYTRENETGDMYIESLVRGIGKHDRVWVATSDSLIQLSAFRTGVLRLSARELKAEVDSACGEMTALLQAMDRAQTVARQQEKRGQIPEKLLRLLPE